MTTETTLTLHEFSEFTRAAIAMYARGCNPLGHLLSVVAAKRIFRGPVEERQLDAARDIYRNWLMFDEPKEG